MASRWRTFVARVTGESPARVYCRTCGHGYWKMTPFPDYDGADRFYPACRCAPRRPVAEYGR